MISTFALIVSIFTLQFFTFSSFVVEGPSMEPALHSGDIFLTEKAWDEQKFYERGDVVVFTLEDDPDYFYVKRVVGLPGETVQVRSDGIYVNGVRTSETYLPAGVSSVPRSAAYREDFEQIYRVPPDAYFVLGDNREQSLDSRHFREPFIPRSRIEGRRIYDLITQDESLGWSTLVVHTQQGPVPFVVEVAETEDQRRTGLMFREKLPKGHGMYFIFEDEANRAFWMQNTLIPLDMIFIDANNRIVHIQKMAQPCRIETCPNYYSQAPARYVLEIGGGESDVFGISAGDIVTFLRTYEI